MKREHGFTVLEALVAIIFLAFAGTLFYIQKNDLEIADRDNNRKTAINAMYYSLEEVFYKQNNYYPATISPDNITSMDPELFTDPNGKTIGDQSSDYRYSPSDCEADKCSSYILRANLENETDFVKTSRH